ncbi:hypothetical protein ACFSCX_20665 [Bacillus salitolerans]|uniref:Uncharacterized protein n=1 Tax=Bacillus salitolerans TaxID=1437434 RepID=A0ABW4LUV4_9BACI
MVTKQQNNEQKLNVQLGGMGLYGTTGNIDVAGYSMSGDIENAGQLEKGSLKEDGQTGASASRYQSIQKN